MATLTETTDKLDAVDEAVDRAASALTAAQRPDGHWVFELEADATIPAEYVLLRHYLGEPVDEVLEAKIGGICAGSSRPIIMAFFGWGLFHGGAFDVERHQQCSVARSRKSTRRSAGAYGVARGATASVRGEGAGEQRPYAHPVRAVRRGAVVDGADDTPELILLPRSFHPSSKMSYWARTARWCRCSCCARRGRSRAMRRA